MNETEKKYTLEDMCKCWEQAQLSTVLHTSQNGYFSFKQFIETLHTDNPKTEDQPTKAESKRTVPKKNNLRATFEIITRQTRR